MPLTTTYTQARAHFAHFCNEAVQSQEVIIIHRRKAGDVALIAADELGSLVETAHLLRSPKNAKRILAALRRARRRTIKTSSVASLKRRIGLEN